MTSKLHSYFLSLDIAMLFNNRNLSALILLQTMYQQGSLALDKSNRRCGMWVQKQCYLHYWVLRHVFILVSIHVFNCEGARIDSSPCKLVSTHTCSWGFPAKLETSTPEDACAGVAFNTPPYPGIWARLSLVHEFGCLGVDGAASFRVVDVPLCLAPVRKTSCMKPKQTMPELCTYAPLSPLHVFEPYIYGPIYLFL